MRTDAQAAGEEQIAGAAREYARAVEAGKRPALSHLSVAQNLAILNELVRNYHLPICRRYAASPDFPEGRFKALDTLRMLILRAPPGTPGDVGDFPPGPPVSDHVFFTDPGSSCLVFVFTGAAHQFGGPIRIMHQWFRSLRASLVYLFDMNWTYYLAGLKGLSQNLEGTIEVLRQFAYDSGAVHCTCLGNSGGGFGALLYAPMLSARRSLVFSPPTAIRESLPAVISKAPEVARLIHPSGSIDLRQVYDALDAPIPSRIHYPELNSHDRMEALNLFGVPGLALEPMKGIENHNLIPHFVSQARFMAELRWLVART